MSFASCFVVIHCKKSMTWSDSGSEVHPSSFLLLLLCLIFSRISPFFSPHFSVLLPRPEFSSPSRFDPSIRGPISYTKFRWHLSYQWLSQSDRNFSAFPVFETSDIFLSGHQSCFWILGKKCPESIRRAEEGDNQSLGNFQLWMKVRNEVEKFFTAESDRRLQGQVDIEKNLRFSMLTWFQTWIFVKLHINLSSSYYHRLRKLCRKCERLE